MRDPIRGTLPDEAGACGLRRPRMFEPEICHVPAILAEARTGLRYRLRRGKVTYFFETPPMKIILFSRAQIAHTPEEIRQLIRKRSAAFGFDYAVNEEFAPLVEQATGIGAPARKDLRPLHRQTACRNRHGLLRRRRHAARRGAPSLRRADSRNGHQRRAPGVPDQRPERRAEPDLPARSPKATSPTEPRSMLAVTGEFARQPDIARWRSTNSPCSATAQG